MATAKELLVGVFNKIENLVEYNSKWENGTGYLDHAVNDTSIVFDEDGYAKAVSPAGRKIVIVKTIKGNAVVFERYTDSESSVVVSNIPHRVAELFQMSGSLSSDQVRMLVGDPAYKTIHLNIGKAIEQFMAPLTKREVKVKEMLETA
jgi:hypothetical protein